MNHTDESYLQYLPPVLWQESGEPLNFLQRFLHIFENIFNGLEKEVEDISKLLNPWTIPPTFKITEQTFTNLKAENVPDEILTVMESIKDLEFAGLERFIETLKILIGEEQTGTYKSYILKYATSFNKYLPWLASWVALELDKSWTERQARTLIRHIVSLYRKRGTIQGLQSYLRIYVGSNVRIEELPVDISAHIFKIIISYPTYENPAHRAERARQVRTIVDKEKPAHTHYNLIIENPTMQIGVHSTIGVDTILGTL